MKSGPPWRMYARLRARAAQLGARGRRSLCGLLALLFVLLLAALYQRQTSLVERFRFDDSYITLRYAQQLTTHGILSFNPDERIDGYTSPGWTLLLALVDGSGLDPAEGMLALARVAGFLSVLVACALARALGASWLLSCVIPALGVLYTPGFIVWSIPGMEMPFAALIYAALLWQMALPTLGAGRERARLFQSCLRACLLFAAALARPEGALLASVLWLAELVLSRAELSSAGAHTKLGRAPTTRSWLPALAPLLIVLVLLTGLVIWRWTFYGYALPNTFYAKSPTPALIERGIADARRFVGQRGMALAPLAALFLAASQLPRRARLVCLAFAFWFVCVLLVYARSGGDFPGFHRFYQPLVPAAFAVLACALSQLTAALRARAPRSRLRSAVAPLAALVCAICLVDFHSAVLSEAFVKNSGLIASQTEQVASWARAGRALKHACARGTCPHPTRVATRAAGAVPHYACADRVYDTLALNNPDVAHHNRAVRDVPAHQKEATDAQVLAWSPNIIVGHPRLGAQDLSGRVPAWLDNPGFRRAGFDYRCIPTELSGEFFCFWQR
jgi:hypothetical protein